MPTFSSTWAGISVGTTRLPLVSRFVSRWLSGCQVVVTANQKEDSKQPIRVAGFGGLFKQLFIKGGVVCAPGQCTSVAQCCCAPEAASAIVNSSALIYPKHLPFYLASQQTDRQTDRMGNSTSTSTATLSDAFAESAVSLQALHSKKLVDEAHKMQKSRDSQATTIPLMPEDEDSGIDDDELHQADRKVRRARMHGNWLYDIPRTSL
jgi:hypothetical protein